MDTERWNAAEEAPGTRPTRVYRGAWRMHGPPLLPRTREHRQKLGRSKFQRMSPLARRFHFDIFFPLLDDVLGLLIKVYAIRQADLFR